MPSSSPAPTSLPFFSMTFFNWQPGAGESIISDQLWIYFAFTVPMTMVVVGGWWLWERKREARYRAEDEDVERGSEMMEMGIMATMRKRTMSKASTLGCG